MDIVPASLPPPSVDLDAEVPVSQRTDPLTREQFEAMLDSDGRLVNEHQLRQAVFLGMCVTYRYDADWSVNISCH